MNSHGLALAGGVHDRPMGREPRVYEKRATGRKNDPGPGEATLSLPTSKEKNTDPASDELGVV